jgi:hypothetical protein
MRLATLLLMAVAACTTRVGGVTYDAHLRASVDLGASVHAASIRHPAKTQHKEAKP